jgi:hypothetical protein
MRLKAVFLRSIEVPTSKSIHRTETYKNAGQPIIYIPTQEDVDSQKCYTNAWYPFTSATEFWLAEILITHRTGQPLIDDLLKDDSRIQLSIKESLKSSYILRQKIEQMSDCLGPHSWNQHTTNLWWNQRYL